MKKSIHSDELPRFIHNKIKDFMIDNDRVLPAVKVLKLCRDYAATVKHLWRNTPDEHLKKITDRIDEVVIDHIAMQIRDDEKPVILSEFPEIRLEYRLIDRDVIVYRYIYFGGGFVTEWKTINNQFHLATDVGREAYQIVRSVLENAHG